MLITLVPCNRSLWEDFKQYHYMTTPLNKASRTFLALANSVPVGFCASLPMPSGTLKNAYRAHKTVVRLPESPAMFKLWALVADAQAKLHVAEGKRFFSAAPLAYAAYRDNPESIWVPTSTDRQRVKLGFRSHESQTPQSGWVPTSKDKKRIETGLRSHEFVTAENHPAHLARDFAKESMIQVAAQWLPDFLKSHAPHGCRENHILAHRPENLTARSVLDALNRVPVTLRPSKIREETFSASGNKRYHLVGAPQCDGDCGMCTDCCTQSKLGDEHGQTILH